MEDASNTIKSLRQEIDLLKKENLLLRSKIRDDEIALKAKSNSSPKNENASEIIIGRNDLYYKAFSLSGVPMVIIRIADGAIIEANEMLASVSGWACNEMIGKSPVEFNMWYKPEQRLQLIGRLLQTRKIQEFECQFRLKSGDIRDFIVDGTIIDYINEPCFLLVARDVTECNADKRQLKLSEEKYKSIFDYTSLGIFQIRNDGAIVNANAALIKMFGYDSLEDVLEDSYYMVSQLWLDFSKSDDFLDSIDSDNSYYYESLGTRRDGTPFWFTNTIHSVIHNNGQAKDYMGMVTDITEKRKTDEALFESAHKYSTLVEQIPLGIYRTTGDGIIIHANQALARILEFSNPDDLVGRSVYKFLVNPKDRDNQLIEWSFPNVTFANEFMLKTKTGRLIWVRDSGSCIFNENGEIVYFDGIMEDITDRRESEEKISMYVKELKELNANKDKFFSIIAHDLKNPISAFVGLSKLLATNLQSMTITELIELSTDMHSSTQHLFKLLENLLQWSRIQRGTIEYIPDNYQLYFAVESNISLSNLNARQKDISLKNETVENHFVRADINMLNTVLRNLITNAIKFTDKGGEVSVKSSPYNGKFIKVTVQDNGIGMDDRTLSKLFRIDTQITQHGTANETGTGLGLILCKELVEKNGGNISVESAPGKGTAFSFTIPADS
ncbi:MAG: hypothetical protein QG635_7 [Bacteroidota bacterium]|nr:hypothetical protein [Bacteroidota bacterium]